MRLQRILTKAAKTVPLVLALLGTGCTSHQVDPIRSGAFVPEEDEAKLWADATAVQEVLRDSELLYDDEGVEAYLNSVAARLLPHLQGGDTVVRVEVVRDPFINAFALPNGGLYVHTGLLAAVDNEAQLAVVIGHEIAHFLRRHALRQRRSAETRQAVAKGVLAVLAVAAAGVSGDVNAARAFMKLGTPVADSIVTTQVKGFSRDLEREADEGAVQAALAAGYDPRQAPKVFEKLKEQEDEAGVREPFYLSDHPALDERIATCKELLEESGNPSGGRTAEQEYLASAGKVLLVNAALDMRMRRLARSRRAIERYCAAFPSDPQGAFDLGELERRFGDGNAAIAQYRRSIELDPTFAPAHREIGLLLQTRGDGAAACAALTRYLELAGDAADRPIIAGYREEIDGCALR